MAKPDAQTGTVIQETTYAEFLHPDEENPGQVEYSEREVDDRNPRVPPGWPADAIGVRFFDRITVTFTYKGEEITCTSERRNPSAGTTFYKGEVLYRSDFDQNSGRLLAVKIPTIVKQTIEATMHRNGWDAVIYIDGLALPLDPKTDKTL